MSQEESTGRFFKAEQERGTGGFFKAYVVAWVLVPAVLLVGLVVYILKGGSGANTTGGTTVTDVKDTRENFLAGARKALAGQADLATCRTAVQLLNGHLRQDPEARPA